MKRVKCDGRTGGLGAVAGELGEGSVFTGELGEGGVRVSEW